jgi:hypothetical protein
MDFYSPATGETPLKGSKSISTDRTRPAGSFGRCTANAEVMDAINGLSVWSPAALAAYKAGLQPGPEAVGGPSRRNRTPGRDCANSTIGYLHPTGYDLRAKNTSVYFVAGDTNVFAGPVCDLFQLYEIMKIPGGARTPTSSDGALAAVWFFSISNRWKPLWLNSGRSLYARRCTRSYLT